MSEAWKCPSCRSICDPAWKRCPYCVGQEADAAKVIQDQLDGDWTTNNSVAFMEYFGERAARALTAAGLLPTPTQRPGEGE